MNCLGCYYRTWLAPTLAIGRRQELCGITRRPIRAPQNCDVSIEDLTGQVDKLLGAMDATWAGRGRTDADEEAQILDDVLVQANKLRMLVTELLSRLMAQGEGS